MTDTSNQSKARLVLSRKTPRRTQHVTVQHDPRESSPRHNAIDPIRYDAIEVQDEEEDAKKALHLVSHTQDAKNTAKKNTHTHTHTQHTHTHTHTQQKNETENTCCCAAPPRRSLRRVLRLPHARRRQKRELVARPEGSCARVQFPHPAKNNNTTNSSYDVKYEANLLR